MLDRAAGADTSPAAQTTPETRKGPDFVNADGFTTGMLKIGEIHRGLRDEGAAYARDASGAGLINDLLAWSTVEDDSGIALKDESDFAALRTELEKKLTDDEIDAIRERFKSNIDSWINLLDRIDTNLLPANITPEKKQAFWNEIEARITSDILRASFLPPESQERRNMQAFIDSVRLLPKIEGLGSASTFAEVIDKSVAQVTMMKWLESQGCCVVYPSPNKDGEFANDELEAFHGNGFQFAALTPTGDIVLFSAQTVDGLRHKGGAVEPRVYIHPQGSVPVDAVNLARDYYNQLPPAAAVDYPGLHTRRGLDHQNRESARRVNAISIGLDPSHLGDVGELGAGYQSYFDSKMPDTLQLAQRRSTFI